MRNNLAIQPSASCNYALGYITNLAIPHANPYHPRIQLRIVHPHDGQSSFLLRRRPHHHFPQRNTRFHTPVCQRTPPVAHSDNGDIHLSFHVWMIR